MIPYSSCMRFNNQDKILIDSGSKKEHTDNDPDMPRGDSPPGETVLSGQRYNPSEWKLIQHFDAKTGSPNAYINVTSQDDQTLCFAWSFDRASQVECGTVSCPNSVSSSSDRRDSGDSDSSEKNIYLFLTLRRRKSLQQSIHSEAVSLLDLSYYGITERYLRQSYKWNFNTFSLDILTGGHSLSSLLYYLFKQYNFIEIFQLDLVNVLRCFYYLENGYHDTNPYHNSVHAADVTQAMHCFLQESNIGAHLTPLESMCALLAAASHDLDHPGVNQNFLVSTKSHLAALYNNLSILESHHWRFAISCFHESHIFDHLSKEQWAKIELLLQKLILATDISRQSEYITQFRQYRELGSNFTSVIDEHKYFLLQIALKCADLGNPCRPWNISHKWSVQICNEFYRQGDFERQLNLPVTSICDRKTMTIPKIQTEFFKNIVRPLFELWHEYLDSKLSRQLMNNLNFNDYMWKTMEGSSSVSSLNNKRRNSFSSLQSLEGLNGSRIRSKSMNDINKFAYDGNFDRRLSVDLINELKKQRKLLNRERVEEPKAAKDGDCSLGDGCSDTGKELDTTGVQEADDLLEEDDDFVMDRFNDDCGAILSTPALLLPNYYSEKAYYSSRRGSAPGCIDIRKNDLNTNKSAALFLLRNSKKSVAAAATLTAAYRRSSFPAVKYKPAIVMAANYTNAAAAAAHDKKYIRCGALQCPVGPGSAGEQLTSAAGVGSRKDLIDASLIYNTSVGCKVRAKLFEGLANYRTAAFYDYEPSGHHHHHHHHHNHHHHHHHYSKKKKSHSGGSHAGSRRRGSVPQDLFIRSLNNYSTTAIK